MEEVREKEPPSSRALIARNLKALRKLRNLSQFELSERAGCSATLIGNIETCKRFPSPENIDAIAQALGVRPENLLAERGPLSSPGALAAAIRSELEACLPPLIEARVAEAVDRAFAKLDSPPAPAGPDFAPRPYLGQVAERPESAGDARDPRRT